MAKEGWSCSSGNKLSVSDVYINCVYTNLARNEACKEKTEINAVFDKYPIFNDMLGKMHKHV